MSSNTDRYFPKAPENINRQILEPSAAFRQEVFGVLKSILLFIATYFMLVLSACGLAVLCGMAGFWLITTITNLWVLIFGIGLIGVGLMVLFFLFKFVFKRNVVDRSNMTEIKEKDHPLLFEFIKRTAKETQTPLPKRVYLTPDVNASVFYDSGFWSMFLPIRKNLNIGLGLVNALNVTEFKAVIAHEFGHFSQRSMKLGSYVYNVNHVIHDMLYDNNSYAELLQSWGSVSNVFAFFAELTGAIVGLIIRILQKVYVMINERYMALSRQMEFHADTVAASVSGSMPLVNALYKIDFASMGYSTVLEYYNSGIRENHKGLNVYQHQSIVMKHMADVHQLKTESGLVHVTEDAFKKFHTSRIVIKNQWASHPSNEDRAQHLKSLDLHGENLTASAWMLFNHPEKVQEEITGELYANVKFQNPPSPIDAEKFRELYFSDIDRYNFNPEYQGFYDNRNMARFDPETLPKENANADTVADILTPEILTLQLKVNGIQNDIHIVEQIRSKALQVKSFDFNGEKFTSEQAGHIHERLKKELADAQGALEQTDKKLFLLFYKKSGEEAISHYKKLFAMQAEYDSELKQINSMLWEASQLYQGRVTEGMALAVTNNMKREGEVLKQKLKAMLADASFNLFISADERKTVQKYVDDNRPYYYNAGFNSESMNLYMETLQLYGKIMNERFTQIKKSVLNKQVQAIAGTYATA
jgi:Zn-dependent protease with chaperone function